MHFVLRRSIKFVLVALSAKCHFACHTLILTTERFSFQARKKRQKKYLQEIIWFNYLYNKMHDMNFDFYFFFPGNLDVHKCHHFTIINPKFILFSDLLLIAFRKILYLHYIRIEIILLNILISNLFLLIYLSNLLPCTKQPMKLY